MLTAWGDESGSQPDRDPNTYLLAAALCDEEDVPTVRKAMEALRLGHETKVHWHGSSSDRRHELVAAVSELKPRRPASNPAAHFQSHRDGMATPKL
ncbi:hypothetical protein ACH47B_26895 [Rhodococcus sp. NPDC019627]|uniref:hypothetical protein n=1 Tax=unclassified Rhodococcus (in: high G+C Gram-positive bacteria) TaxID=192944 RepID=UPI00378E5FF5